MPITGTMKYLQIGDATYEIYNTDQKVSQSYKAASGYTYWRPLLVGYSSGSAEDYTPTDQTDLAYTFDTLKVQPSTGTLRFNAAALVDDTYTSTISAGTLTANRTLAVPDKSGTIALTSDISTAIAELPTPMSFKGSVGTGGTITSLPAAAAANEGYTYKVITDLSSPVTAKVGDTVISNGSTWIVIPSGDEPSGTVTSVGLTNASDGGLTISGSPITSSGIISIGHSNVLTSAQTTSAVYPIKIDKNGHISEYGSAVTIPTKVSDLTNDSGFITSYTDEKVKANAASNNTTYYPIFGSNSGNAETKNYTSALSYKHYSDSGELWIGDSSHTPYLVFKNGSYDAALVPSTLTAPRIIVVPNKDGTIALTSDIPTVHNVPSGGSSGQVLTKNSGTDYDLVWTTVSSGIDEKVVTNAVTSGTTYYPIVGINSNTASTKNIDATGFVYEGVNGSGGSPKAAGDGTATLTLGNNLTSSTANWKAGILKLYGSTTYATSVNAGAPTADRSIILPDKSGTIALTDDIPTITLNGSTSTTPSFYAPTTAGTSGQVLTSSGSGAPTWMAAPAGVYFAEYNVTTYANIKAAIDAGKEVILVDDQTSSGGAICNFYRLAYHTGTFYASGYNSIGFTNDSESYWVTVDESNTWNYGDFQHNTIKFTDWGTYALTLQAPSTISSSNKTITLPDKSGTVALTSDIPTIHIETTAPTSADGEDGDVWFIYTPSV